MTTRTEEHPCTRCGEDTYNDTLCRDCDIETSLDRMHCKKCSRMRYRHDDEMSSALGAWLWGDPCVCDVPELGSGA